MGGSPFVLAGILAALAFGAAPMAAHAGLPAGLEIEALYIADLLAVVDGGDDRGARYLDDLEIAALADLEEIAGWRGGRIGLRLLSNQGGNPNALAGTLQGVDNVEVADHRLKLFELWFGQSFAGDRADLRLGLFDLNDEFYASVASEDLLGPSFGIGPELGATGPNGPSIFPSAALNARLLLRPADDLYLQALVGNARAGSIGDRGGVDTDFDDGLLVVGEAGWTGRGKIALGLWRYTEAQPVVPEVPGLFATAQGLYLLFEQPLGPAAGAVPATEIFFRAGLSDGDTSPFRASWQAGLRVTGLVPGRPLGRLSFGIQQGLLARRFRDFGIAAEPGLAAAETGFELTYADPLAPFLTVQPDVQYVLNPSGRRSVGNAVVLGLRLTFAWPTD